MSQFISIDQYNSVADGLLQQGISPSLSAMADALLCDQSELTNLHDKWWQLLPQRLQLSGVESVAIPGLPESLSKSFQSLWSQAVQEAHASILHDKKYQNMASEESRKHSENELKRAHDSQTELEISFRELRHKLEEEQSHVQGLEAEISVLKINLATAMTECKGEEQKRLNLEQEMVLLQKKLDDSKRTFDQRVIEEQRRSLEQVAKAEADVRYYRNGLEKLRDESGRKDSALTKDVHNLQALVAKKDVKLDTHKNQIKTLESELKRFKSEGSHSGRERSKLMGNLLAEQNKNKRLEDKVKQLGEDYKSQTQKLMAGANEAARRESVLRGQLKDKDEDLMRSDARFSGLEKRITSQDEEIRRLKSRV